MQIAIDGPAGAGKSTIAKMIAKDLDIIYLDTGAMYRAITYGVMEAEIPFSDEAAIIDFTEKSTIDFDGSAVRLNGGVVTEEIRRPLVSQHTSDIACIQAVRDLLVEEQRQIAANHSVIMDGRDIASVVLPQAQYKFYLDASITERAMRRMKELAAKGIDKSLDEVKADIAARDYNDTHRDAGPLVCTEDAVIIDTTGKSISEVCGAIMAHIKGVPL